MVSDIVDDGTECVCAKIYIEQHTCPYKEDIFGDSESMCSCCEYCRNNCALDI
jgi:hypothetical protein